MGGKDKSDLKVDYELLATSEKTLKNIRTAFENCTKRQNALAEAVGAKKLRDAMHDFADNWSDNRKQTLANLGEFIEMVTTVKDSFQDLDKKLGEEASGKKK